MTSFACPNMPKCPHPSFVHDVFDAEDDRPTCCADGCTCGSVEFTADVEVTPGHDQAAIDIYIAAREDGATKQEAEGRAERETAACSYCWRLANLTKEQQETEPWPAEVRSCSAHRRVREVLAGPRPEETA